ncbi:MAG: ATP-binding cassette domain-containing protein [Chloroflexi bacterium]|nr:ATP-binding cassette domain-containing protein [Chloroflexota bacterium]
MTTSVEQSTTQSGSVPSAPGINPGTDAIISIRNLRKWYQVGGGFLGFGTKIYLKAVDDVSFDIERGKTFGLVGESGCGKTTTLKLLLGLEVPSAGSSKNYAGTIYYEGQDVKTMTKAGRTEFKRSVQAVFQDPWSSLNPRMRVRAIVGEPLEIATTMTKKAIVDRVSDLLSEVGLNPYQANLYPHEFSGGQRQRIGIARALALNPKVIALDEPVSALDVSIRAQIMNLLVDLQTEHGLAYLLVAHNLATVRYMCHDMAVMYLGVVQESGETEAIFNNPMHIYTNALVSAALPSHPDIQREEFLLPGEVVSPIDPPPGDVFMTRTPLEVDPNHKWANERPPLVEKEPGHWVVDTPWSMAADAGLRVELKGQAGV